MTNNDASKTRDLHSVLWKTDWSKPHLLEEAMVCPCSSLIVGAVFSRFEAVEGLMKVVVVVTDILEWQEVMVKRQKRSPRRSRVSLREYGSPTSEVARLRDSHKRKRGTLKASQNS